MLCLYCPDELGPHNRSLAHVIPDALGGRLQSDEICCHPCNNSFTAIESPSIAVIAPVSAMMKARRGDGSPIEAEFEHDGRRFRVADGGMFEEAPPPTDRGRQWAIPANDDRQVSMVTTMLKQRRLPPEAIIDGRLAVRDAPAEPDPHGLTNPDAGVTRNMEWGFPATKRLQFKIACDLLAHSRPDLARSNILRPAWVYARHGIGDFHVPFDSSTTGSGLDEVSAAYRHVIEIWTRGSSLHARLGLFTELRFVATLTTCWDGPAFRISYSFNCLNPKDMSVAFGDGDGDFVVRKSSDGAHRELLDASARLSDTMKRLTPDVRAYRADALPLDELYRRIKPAFDSKPWATRWLDDV